MGKISKSVKGLIGLSTLGAVGLKGYKDLDEIKEEGLKEYLKGEAEELKKKGVIDYGKDEYKEFEELKDKLMKNPSITSIKEQSIKYPNIIKETIIKENVIPENKIYKKVIPENKIYEKVIPEDKIYEEIIESNFSKLKDYGYEKMNGGKSKTLHSLYWQDPEKSKKVYKEDWEKLRKITRFILVFASPFTLFLSLFFVYQLSPSKSNQRRLVKAKKRLNEILQSFTAFFKHDFSDVKQIDHIQKKYKSKFDTWYSKYQNSFLADRTSNYGYKFDKQKYNELVTGYYDIANPMLHELKPIINHDSKMKTELDEKIKKLLEQKEFLQEEMKKGMEDYKSYGADDEKLEKFKQKYEKKINKIENKIDKRLNKIAFFNDDSDPFYLFYEDKINNFRNQFNFSYENWKKRQLIKNLGIGAAGATAATGLGYLVHQPAIGKFKELHKKFTDWQEQNAKDKAAQEAWDNLTPAEQQAIKNIENEKHQKQVADAEAKFRAQDQNIEGGEEIAGTGIDTPDIAAAAFFSQKDLDYYWDKLKNFNRGGGILTPIHQKNYI